jgi:Flp pilus assembly protein TadD
VIFVAWLIFVTAQGATTDARALLLSYARQPHELRLAGPFNEKAFLSAVEAEIKAGLPGPPEEARRAVAAFGLEVAAARMIAGDTASGRTVLEWACQKVRAHEPADAFDRQWHRAAAALAQAVIDPVFVERHVEHATLQLGADPELTLALAIAGEQYESPSFRRAAVAAATTHREGVEAAQQDAAAARRRDDTVRRLERAAASPATAGEAWLRLGHLRATEGRVADALAAFARVGPATRDPWVLYLAAIFEGQAFEATGRRDDATAAYRRALALGATGQSATVALATLLHATGQRDAAAAMIERWLSETDRIDDPWWSYWGGRSRLWDAYIADVRSEIR